MAGLKDPSRHGDLPLRSEFYLSKITSSHNKQGDHFVEGGKIMYGRAGRKGTDFYILARVNNASFVPNLPFSQIQVPGFSEVDFQMIDWNIKGERL